MVRTDTELAGCKKGRNRISGGMLLHGRHVIKLWSTIQATIALSPGESEYYGMVEGAIQALGLRAVAEDLRVIYLYI